MTNKMKLQILGDNITVFFFGLGWFSLVLVIALAWAYFTFGGLAG